MFTIQRLEILIPGFDSRPRGRLSWGFPGLFSVPPDKCREGALNRPLPLPSTSLPIHHSAVSFRRYVIKKTPWWRHSLSPTRHSTLHNACSRYKIVKQSTIQFSDSTKNSRLAPSPRKVCWNPKDAVQLITQLRNSSSAHSSTLPGWRSLCPCIVIFTGLADCKSIQSKNQ